MKKLSSCYYINNSYKHARARFLFELFPKLRKHGYARDKAAKVIQGMRRIIEAKYILRVLKKIKYSTVIQRFVRGFLARRRYQRLRVQDEKVRVIQRYYRENLRGKLNPELITKETLSQNLKESQKHRSTQNRPHVTSTNPYPLFFKGQPSHHPGGGGILGVGKT